MYGATVNNTLFEDGMVLTYAVRLTQHKPKKRTQRLRVIVSGLKFLVLLPLTKIFAVLSVMSALRNAPCSHTVSMCLLGWPYCHTPG